MLYGLYGGLWVLNGCKYCCNCVFWWHGMQQYLYGGKFIRLYLLFWVFLFKISFFLVGAKGLYIVCVVWWFVGEDGGTVCVEGVVSTGHCEGMVYACVEICCGF